MLRTSIVSGFSKNGHGRGGEALKLFMVMRKNGLNLTDHTLTSILNARGGLTRLRQGRQVRSLVTKMGSEGNAFVVGACTIRYVLKVSLIRRLRKNTVLWTSMITRYMLKVGYKVKLKS